MCLRTDTSGNPIVVNANLRAFIRGKIIQYSLGTTVDQFFITPDNILWAATRTNKLFAIRLNEKTEEYFHLLKVFEKELPRLSPRSIAVDHSGNVWVGSRENGLFCLFIGKDLVLHSWRQFTMKDGLSDNYISYLQTDHLGNVWAGSSVGLDKVQMSGNSVLIENITRSNNMYQHVTRVQSSANGVTWVLTTAGVIKLTPAGYIQKNRSTEIFFTRIRAGDHPVSNALSGLTLPFTENDMSFAMAAPTFIDEKQIRFSYLLEGSNTKTWSEPSATPEIRFINLGPGKYTLYVKAIFLNGIYPETATSYTFEILPPWWQTWWFRIALSLVFAGTIVIVVRAHFRSKLRKQTELIERQQAIEKERTRIASDMHDDLGAGLSAIRFLSEKVKQNSLTETTRLDADKIASNSNELVEKMNDIIWAMNEKNDSLEDLLFYSRSYAMEYCEDHHIECRVSLPQPVPDLFISGEIRRNVFLTVKECLHNIVKHASASEVFIGFRVDDHLRVHITDNGKGLNSGEMRRAGNGLYNMQKRVSLLKGSFEIKSSNGVTIDFRIPLNSRE
jgi:signal transduction histidine kinase